jgi:hypothetical protein
MSLLTVNNKIFHKMIKLYLFNKAFLSWLDLQTFKSLKILF